MIRSVERMSDMKCMMVVGFLAALVLAGPAAAYDEQDRAREGVRSGDIQPFSQIKREIERRFDGRMLDAQLSGNGESYNIKMLTPEGDVLVIETDARTGRVLGVKGRR